MLVCRHTFVIISHKQNYNYYYWHTVQLQCQYTYSYAVCVHSSTIKLDCFHHDSYLCSLFYCATPVWISVNLDKIQVYLIYVLNVAIYFAAFENYVHLLFHKTYKLVFCEVQCFYNSFRYIQIKGFWNVFSKLWGTPARFTCRPWPAASFTRPGFPAKIHNIRIEIDVYYLFFPPPAKTKDTTKKLIVFLTN